MLKRERHIQNYLLGLSTGEAKGLRHPLSAHPVMTFGCDYNRQVADILSERNQVWRFSLSGENVNIYPTQEIFFASQRPGYGRDISFAPSRRGELLPDR